ncbi:MAG TPA: type II toxin-antitoxin system VapC family toxin [Vicinamibacterales bacterium]|nr:type II toxin-antitoxin system VapC family toxin [Vicinamibacterales bacterium]
MPVFLDTHAWVWWVTEDHRLSRGAARAIQRASRGAGVSLSMISIWEIAKKVEKKQLVLDRPAREWIEHALGVPGLALVEVTPAILMDSCELPQPFHGDPADQIIVASARHHGATLVTKDSNIRRYEHVSTVW